MPGELSVFGISDESRIYRLLPLYLNELAEWNTRMNLTGPDRGDFRQRHVYDCLAGYPVLSRTRRHTAADVGSGAGLPGLLMAMVLPETRFLLVEKSPKKCQFLRHAVQVCGLENTTVFNGRIGEVREPVELVMFRAVSPLEPVFIRELSSLCSGSTRIAAFKGRKDRILEELASVNDLVKDVEVIPLEVPGLSEERHLVLFGINTY